MSRWDTSIPAKRFNRLLIAKLPSICRNTFSIGINQGKLPNYAFNRPFSKKQAPQTIYIPSGGN